MDDRNKPQSVLRHLNQEKIVFILTIVLFILFSIILPNFLAANNILSLIRSVAVLGILGLGMLIVVLGRGIDLSLVATMAISVAWSLQLMSNGMTIMDIQYTVQNVIKRLILLLAIVVDSILNPRDEQTGQQGDI